MPLYKILPADPSLKSTEVRAADPACVFGIVQRLDCKEADVLQDGFYAFSLRLDANGMWSIFQREAQPASRLRLMA